MNFVAALRSSHLLLVLPFGGVSNSGRDRVCLREIPGKFGVCQFQVCLSNAGSDKWEFCAYRGRCVLLSQSQCAGAVIVYMSSITLLHDRPRIMEHVVLCVCVSIYLIIQLLIYSLGNVFPINAQCPQTSAAVAHD